MSETKRKNFTGELKANVALEAIRGIKTVNEIGQEFGLIVTYRQKASKLGSFPTDFTESYRG